MKFYGEMNLYDCASVILELINADILYVEGSKEGVKVHGLNVSPGKIVLIYAKNKEESK